METETIDKLFLELSHVTRASTAKENRLAQELREARTVLKECANRLDSIQETHPTFYLEGLIIRARQQLPEIPR